MSSHTKDNQELIRAIPPKNMFRGDGEEVIPRHSLTGLLSTPIIDIQFPKHGGVLVYHQGDLYPVKGWPFKEATYACDTIKRAIINGIKFAISSPVRYLLALFVLLPKSLKRKAINNAIEQFTDYTEKVFDVWGRILPLQDEDGAEFGLQGVVWKPQFYCDMVREIRRVGMQMAGERIPNQRLVEAMCMILEFDDAYRYRLQDGFGLIDREALKRDPAKEIVRVLTIMRDRGIGTADKFQSFVKVIPFLFKIRDLKQVFIQFFSQVDLKKLSLDEVDFYRCLLWGGYQFRGIPDPERASLRIMIDAEWQYREKHQAKHS